MKSVCETGIVTGIGGGSARVRLVGESGCRKCGLAALGLCKTGGAGMEIVAACSIPIRVGQQVRVVRGGRGFADGGFAIYGLPVGLLLAGSVIGHLLGPSAGLPPEAGAVLGGLGFFLLSFPAVWTWSRRRDRRGDFLPRIEALDPWHGSHRR